MYNHLFSVTKTFEALPVAHCQYQDVNPDGSPGPCAALHGYDRNVSIEVSCAELDEYGWVFPFGAFKQVRAWLEYYFDHTAVFPAADPRMPEIRKAMDAGFIDARILPYGVSMEMSALFLYENANHYVWENSDGRACITKLEFRENHKNGGHFRIDYSKSMQNAMNFKGEQLVMKPEWEAEKPSDAIARIMDVTLWEPSRAKSSSK